jgi:hypothetical protein
LKENVIYTKRKTAQIFLARVFLASSFALGLPACSGGGHAVPVATADGPAAITTNADPTRVQSSERSLTGVAEDATPATATVTEMPTSADAFVGSVGIETHLVYFTTPYYSDYPAVLSLLKGLNVRHIRDSLNNHNSTTYTERLNQLATLGIHTDAVTAMGYTTRSIQADLALMPNAVEAVEGPNEYDLTGDSDWIAHLRAFQAMMYSAVKHAPNGDKYKVYGPSITSYRDSIALGSLADSLDLGTLHNYFANQNPGTPGGTPFPVGKYNSLQFWIGTGHLLSGSKPLVTTETGYETDAGSNGWVPESVQARYIMRELLLQWHAGIERTYLYELLDEGGQSYGLVSGSLAKKPAYTALANLLGKLDDPGPSFTLKPLTYAMSAASSVDHVLLQKRDGSYRFMCWDEVPQTDPKTPTQSVTIVPSEKFSTVVQYVWQDDGTIKTIPLSQSKTSSITFTVTDRMSEIKLFP